MFRKQALSELESSYEKSHKLKNLLKATEFGVATKDTASLHWGPKGEPKAQPRTGAEPNG